MTLIIFGKTDERDTNRVLVLDPRTEREAEKAARERLGPEWATLGVQTLISIQQVQLVTPH